jgi:general secretion pathway protein D
VLRKRLADKWIRKSPFILFCVLIAGSVSVSAEDVTISGAKGKTVNLREKVSALPGPGISVSPSATGSPISESRKTGFNSGNGGGQRSPSSEVSGKKMMLNFEAAPIREVIKNISEFIGMNYIIEDGVKGFVTIRTLDSVPVSSALDLLDQLLMINNLTRVKIGKYWRFLPSSKAMTEPMPVYLDPPATVFAAADRFQIQILTFNYVSAVQALDIIKPFLSKNASVKVLPNSNMLIIVERGVKLVEINDLVRALDIDSLDTMQVKLFELRNSFSAEVVPELIQIYSALGYTDQAKGKGIVFLSLDRMNSVMMINPFPKLFPTIQSWVDKLDAAPMEMEQLSTFIYDVQNGDAADLSKVLQQLYTLDAELGGGAGAGKGKTGKKLKSEITSTPIVGPLQIIAHPVTNSIIIRTARRNYPIIEETLKRLDEKALQVLIEVLITDITLSDELQFGLEWAIRSSDAKDFMALSNNAGLGNRGSLGTNLDTAAYNPTGGTGLSFFTRPEQNVMGLIHALASDSKLEVRASPMLMTTDNKPASIDITSEVPISTTSFSTTGAEVQNIQYKSVGIRLSVTPKINEDKYVSLSINQEISQIDDTRSGPNNEPYFFRRQAKTEVVVKDRQTLMIGGMIQNTKGVGARGIPFLSSIPIIGWLFGAKETKEEKTELLILLTPHVIASDEEAEILTEDYKRKILGLQKSVRLGKKRIKEAEDNKKIKEETEKKVM